MELKVASNNTSSIIQELLLTGITNLRQMARSHIYPMIAALHRETYVVEYILTNLMHGNRSHGTKIP